MYLGGLNDQLKHLFLELEICMSKVDGDFSEEEKTIIEAHCMEMHIDNNNYVCEKSANEVIEEIVNQSNEQEKRIVLLELMATVLADGVYHEIERKVITRLVEAFSLSTKEEEEAVQIILKIKEAYCECASFVKGE